MNSDTELKSLSDDALLSRLRELLQESRAAESELVAHIGEVDLRRLYARQSSSMFSYCTGVLHLSEAEAYLRIAAARAARKHPVLLEMLADGRLHLTGIAKLAPHLDDLRGSQRDTLLERAAHKSKREIEELVAEISPKPDVPARMRKLPERKEEADTPSSADLPSSESRGRAEATPAESSESRAGPSLREVPPSPRRDVRGKVEPLSPERYKIEFTASVELRDKLKRLQALMRSRVPDGDLAALIDEAVTEKLERLEARRFGKTKAPRKSLAETDTTPTTRHIPAAVRREVWARDRSQCTFVDADGRRCTKRDDLEYHHRDPFARGGDHSVDNVCLMCRAHNTYLAENDYGREVMERYRRGLSQVREPAPGWMVPSTSGILGGASAWTAV